MRIHYKQLIHYSTYTGRPLFQYSIISYICSNPSVQTQVLFYEGLPSLLPLLSPNKPELLQRRAIFALSALLRGQPSAAKSFLKGDGIELLSSKVEQRSGAVLTKLVVLLTDLLSMEVGLCAEIFN